MTEPFESLIANWENPLYKFSTLSNRIPLFDGTPPKNLWKRFQTVEQTKATVNGAESVLGRPTKASVGEMNLPDGWRIRGGRVVTSDGITRLTRRGFSSGR